MKNFIYNHFGKIDNSIIKSDIKYYDIDISVDDIISIAKKEGYSILEFTEYNKPDFSKYSYFNGFVWIYSPNNSFASFHDVTYTRKWRYIHELCHARTYNTILNMFKIDKIIRGTGVLSLENSIIAMAWELLTLNEQYKFIKKYSNDIDEKSINREINTLFSDLLHRCFTGDFLEPDLDKFIANSNEIVTINNYKTIITQLYNECIS